MLDDKQVFVFDLDGTLIDSMQDVMIALNDALEICGFNRLDNLSVKALIGPDLRDLLADTINDNSFDFDVFEKEFVRLYKDQKFSTTTLYPEVVETLSKLVQKNKKVYVLTNKPSYQSIDILKHLNIDKFIDKIIGPDTYNLAKPNPIGISKIQEETQCELIDMVFIGDTEIDIQTAKNANITSVAVSYGYRDSVLLENEKPTYIISSLSDLFTLKTMG